MFGFVENGGQAKEVIQDGFVSVNGEVETRRGRKLYPNDVVSYEENELTVYSFFPEHYHHTEYLSSDQISDQEDHNFCNF